jgi:hypothetical protein
MFRSEISLVPMSPSLEASSLLNSGCDESGGVGTKVSENVDPLQDRMPQMKGLLDVDYGSRALR